MAERVVIDTQIVEQKGSDNPSKALLVDVRELPEQAHTMVLLFEDTNTWFERDRIRLLRKSGSGFEPVAGKSLVDRLPDTDTNLASYTHYQRLPVSAEERTGLRIEIPFQGTDPNLLHDRALAVDSKQHLVPPPEEGPVRLLGNIARINIDRAMDLGQRAIDLYRQIHGTDDDRGQAMAFFLKLDEATAPAPGRSRSSDFVRSIKSFDSRLQRRVLDRAACARVGWRLVPADPEELARECSLDLEALEEHLFNLFDQPTAKGRVTPFDRIDDWAEMFVRGMLRPPIAAESPWGESARSTVRTYDGAGMPNSANYFLFTEICLVLADWNATGPSSSRRSREHKWRDAARAFARTAELFTHIYWNGRGRTWDSYTRQAAHRTRTDHQVLASLRGHWAEDGWGAAKYPRDYAEDAFSIHMGFALRDQCIYRPLPPSDKTTLAARPKDLLTTASPNHAD